MNKTIKMLCELPIIFLALLTIIVMGAIPIALAVLGWLGAEDLILLGGGWLYLGKMIHVVLGGSVIIIGLFALIFLYGTIKSSIFE